MNRKTRRTEAQREASRANGAKSQGPVTPEGKAISSQNATIHAFDATRLCTTYENAAQLEALVNNYTADLRPANATESDLVQQMAFAQFRLNRIQILETTFFNAEIFESRQQLPKEFTDDPPCHILHYAAFKLLMKREPINAMAMIDRYESRYRRAYDRALAALRNLQKDRRRAELHELKLERERRRMGIERPAGKTEVGVEETVPETTPANAERFLRNEPEPAAGPEAQNTRSEHPIPWRASKTPDQEEERAA